MPNPFETPLEPPKRHGLRERLIRAATIGPGDKALQKRAEWMIDELRVQKYLAPKIRFSKPINGKFNLERNNVERGVSVLCVGAGKGHELDELDQILPGSTIVGFDPHDFLTVPVDERLGDLAHDARYLGEHVRAESMQGIENGTMDGVTLNFVLHHIDEKNHLAVFAEIRRVLKKDGFVFIAEDLADNAQEAKIVETADRRINMEIAQDAPHNYRSREQWHEFFRRHGFEIVEDHEIKPEKVRHGFFVLRRQPEKR